MCDQPQAGVISRAKRAGVKVAKVERGGFSSKEDFEARIIEILEENKIDLIVLAGFMRLLSAAFVARYKGRIINVHPALLPSFKGAYGIKEAYEFGAKVTGATVHFVDEEMDHGPIILQKAVSIEEDDTLETLEKKIHRIEHAIYPEAIQLIMEGRLKLEGRKVKVLNSQGPVPR